MEAVVTLPHSVSKTAACPIFQTVSQTCQAQPVRLGRVRLTAPTRTEGSLTPSGGVRKTHGVWRGLFAGNEQCRSKANGGDDDDRKERRAVALVFREEW